MPYPPAPPTPYHSPFSCTLFNRVSRQIKTVILCTLHVLISDDRGVAHLYKRIISPSLTVTGNEWLRQSHCRHANDYQKHERASSVVRQKASSPVRTVVSSPGCLDTSQVVSQVSEMEKRGVCAGGLGGGGRYIYTHPNKYIYIFGWVHRSRLGLVGYQVTRQWHVVSCLSIEISNIKPFAIGESH